jgi:hypothetical protein
VSDAEPTPCLGLSNLPEDITPEELYGRGWANGNKEHQNINFGSIFHLEQCDLQYGKHQQTLLL